MKRKYITLIISVLFFLISCSPEIKAPENLRFISNVNTILPEGSNSSGSREDRIGDPIIGVGLMYTTEGAFDEYTKPVDDNTFSLNCIYRTAENADKMQYNYILYVPASILTEYQAVTADYRISGNPFWWYMRNYHNMYYSEIISDWPSTLDYLKSYGALPYPDRNDFTEDNTDEYGNLLKSVENLFIRSTAGMDYELGVNQTLPVSMRRLSSYGFTATEEEMHDFILVKNPYYTENEWSHIIFFPVEIEEAYKEAYPDYNGTSGNPFWTYIKQYYGVTVNDTATVILKTISAGDYKAPTAGIISPSRNLFVRSADGMDYELGVRQLSPSPMRKLKDPALIEIAEAQKDFILVQHSNNYDEEWTHTIFYPDEIEEAYKNEHPEYDGKSGDPFWDYIAKYYKLTIDDTSTVILKAISAGEYKSPVS